MAESYIPQNTLAICTNMTIPQPQQLKSVKQKQQQLVNTSMNGDIQPILNADDRAISQAFQCKNAAMFWGGWRHCAPVWQLLLWSWQR